MIFLVTPFGVKGEVVVQPSGVLELGQAFIDRLGTAVVLVPFAPGDVLYRLYEGIPAAQYRYLVERGAARAFPRFRDAIELDFSDGRLRVSDLQAGRRLRVSTMADRLTIRALYPTTQQ